MSESFAELFEESLKTLDMQPGAIITGIVVDIDGDWVTVHAGLKSEGVIPVEQFYNEQGELTISVGDEVHVALDAVEDGFGETKLSREKAKRAECWIVLEAAFAAEEVVKGVINGKVKGGFTVDVNGIRAFLPGSLVDVRPVRDTTHLEGKDLEFKVTRLFSDLEATRAALDARPRRKPKRGSFRRYHPGATCVSVDTLDMDYKLRIEGAPDVFDVEVIDHIDVDALDAAPGRLVSR